MKQEIKKYSISMIALAAMMQPVAAQDTIVSENILKVLRGDPIYSHTGLQFDDVWTGSTEQAVSKRKITYLPKLERRPFLRGEVDRLDWPLNLSLADASHPVKVRIAFINSVVVMPEVSEIRLLVNNKIYDAKPIRNPDMPGFLEAEIPPSLLSEGRNIITVTTRQRHRVDCSLDATHELWTRIDIPRSTIEYGTGKQVITGLYDLKGLPKNIDQKQVVNLLLPEGSGNHTAGSFAKDYLELLQRVSIAGEYKDLDVQLYSGPQTSVSDDGLDVFVGSYGQLVAHSYISARYSQSDLRHALESSPVDTVIVGSLDGSRTLLIKLQELAQLPDAFSFLEEVKLNKMPILEETSISLRQLGYVEEEFTGRRFSTKVSLNLPADFYSGDYDHIDLNLFASYTEGLKPGQRLLVVVNGKNTVSIPLSKRSGGLIRGKQLEIPLSAFVPGKNSVELIAQLETHADFGHCLDTQQRRDVPRLFLSGDTYFEIPKFAHVGQFPNVHNTLETGFPYRSKDRRGPLWVTLGSNTLKDLEIAGEFISRMSVNAGEVIPIETSQTESASLTEVSKNRLIVSSYASLPDTYNPDNQLVNLAELDNNWRSFELNNRYDPIMTASIPRFDFTSQHLASQQQTQSNGNYVQVAMAENAFSPMSEPAAANANSLRNRLNNNVSRDGGFGFSFDLGRHISNFIEPVTSIIVSNFEKVRSDAITLPDYTAAIVSQSLNGDVVTTLISYGDAESADGVLMPMIEKASASKSVDPIHTIGVDTSLSNVANLPVSKQVFLHDGQTNFANKRLVMAGWLSQNPLVYGFAILFALLSWGIASHLILQRTERHVGSDFEHDY
ncbi:MAG: cellulose biosynthesis cyclic di-GMP-binding regulatory protein BcsB [Pseudomonadota bacterium]